MVRWADLPAPEQQQRARAYATQRTLPTTLPELSLLVQWMLAFDYLRATTITARGNGLTLHCQHDYQPHTEYVRLYLTPPLDQAHIVYDMLDDMKGKDYKKARLFIVASLSPTPNISYEFPLFFDVCTGAKLSDRLADVQRIHCHPSIFELPVKRARRSRRRRQSPPTFLGLTAKQILLIGALLISATVALLALTLWVVLS